MSNSRRIETIEHAAVFEGHIAEGAEVRIYRKSERAPDTLIGVGILRGGLILGSKVNCGILAHFERDLAKILVRPE